MEDDKNLSNFYFHNFFLTRINHCCNTDHNEYILTKARDGGMQCSRCSTCPTFALRHMIDYVIYIQIYNVMVKFSIYNLFYALFCINLSLPQGNGAVQFWLINDLKLFRLFHFFVSL